MPKINMLADGTRHELVPILPCIPYRGIPRHTPQRTLHGITSDARQRRPHSRGGGQSSRAHPLTFVGFQRRRGEKDGPHVSVTSIEALEPDVGEDLRCDAEKRMEECPLTTTQLLAVDQDAATHETTTRSDVPTTASNLTVDNRTMNPRNVRVYSGERIRSTRGWEYPAPGTK